MRKLPFAVLAALLALVATAFAAGNRPNSINLPPNWQPEGIAAHGSQLYVGSLSTGGIFRTDTKGRRTTRLNRGATGRAIAGLKVTGNRIFAAGAATGDIHVFSRRSGRHLRTYDVKDAKFINDVAVSGNAAYFTESKTAQKLYRLRRDGRGGVVPLTITGDLVFTSDEADFDTNGIVAAGSRLITVQSNTGKLFTVRPSGLDAVTREIKLSGLATSLPNGDGLLRKDRTLYVVQNQERRIAVVRLSRDLSSGVVTRFLTNDAQPADAKFVVPTTVARANGDLWVVNAKFNVPNPEPYNIVRVAQANGRGNDAHRGRGRGNDPR